MWGSQWRELGDSGEAMWLHEGTYQHEDLQGRPVFRACACFSQHLENYYIPSQDAFVHVNRHLHP